MQVQKLGGGTPPKKIWGPKTCKISVDFGPPQTLIANIFGTAKDIQNRPTLQTMAIPPAFNEKGPVNFGPLTAWNTCKFGPTTMHFADYISAHRGCCAPKILHALEIDQALIAHNRRGTGVPPKKNSNRENLKFGLKFSVLRSITSGLVAVSSQDFFQSTLREAGVIKWVQFLQCPPPKICCRPKKSPKIFRDF